MRLGVLFSGGKDSCAALWIAQSYGHTIECLLTLDSHNPESYMFHTPNINLTKLQAEAIGIPIIGRATKGEKEKELEDLEALLREAKHRCGIKGVVTGALNSIYQATRIQKACADLGLWVFNPLWQRDEREHVDTLLSAGFEIVITGIGAYPLDAPWLGRVLDKAALTELIRYQIKYGVSPAGEGGELETLVLWAPGWKKRIVIDHAEKSYEDNAGVWHVTKAHLVSTTNRLAPFRQRWPRSGRKLIVSMCAEPLSELEFVLPLLRAVGDAHVVHHLKVTPAVIGRAKAIILSGSPLQDDAFLSGEFAWLRKVAVPVIGICAGMQAIAHEYGASFARKTEIGMTRIVPMAPNAICHHEVGVYALHRNAPELPSGFEALANSDACLHIFQKGQIIGVLFHPEVRQAEMIRRLLVNDAAAAERRTISR